MAPGWPAPAFLLSQRKSPARPGRSALARKSESALTGAPASSQGGAVEPRESELVFTKDGLKPEDRHCARALRKCADRALARWRVADNPVLKNYPAFSTEEGVVNAKQEKFLPTWVLKNSAGEPVAIPPEGKAFERDVWTGKTPLAERNRLALVRDVDSADSSPSRRGRKR